MKYRKKPVVIEAFQMTEEARWDNSDWPDWLNQAWNLDPDETGSVCPFSDEDDRLMILTLEGNHIVSWGDYIIKGVKGEIYPCKPQIFLLTYDLVDQEEN